MRKLLANKMLWKIIFLAIAAWLLALSVTNFLGLGALKRRGISAEARVVDVSVDKGRYRGKYGTSNYTFYFNTLEFLGADNRLHRVYPTSYSALKEPVSIIYDQAHPDRFVIGEIKAGSYFGALIELFGALLIFGCFGLDYFFKRKKNLKAVP